jgi:hypothetical protein
MRDAPVDLSGAAKATGGQSTGPVTREPRPSRTALESGAARRGQAPGERRDRRRTAQLDAPKERKTRRSRHPRTGPRDQTLAITGKPIRPDGPEGNILRTSRKTPGAEDPRLASRTVRP